MADTVIRTLAVRLVADLSEYTGPIAQARAQALALKGDLKGVFTGITTGNVLQTALIAPMAIASTRAIALQSEMGSVFRQIRLGAADARREMGLLAAEQRRLFSAGAGASGPATAPSGAGSAAAIAAAGVIGANAGSQAGGPRETTMFPVGGAYQPSNLVWRIRQSEMEQAAYRAGPGSKEWSDYQNARAAGGLNPIPWHDDSRYIGQPRTQEAASRPPAADFDEEVRRAGEKIAQERANPRSGGGFGKQAQRGISQGFGQALGDLFGKLAREAGPLGEKLAKLTGTAVGTTLAFVGLGAIMPVLTKGFVGFGAAATAVFAALTSPLAAVIAGITAFVALFAAANWDRVLDLLKFLQERFDEVLGPRLEKMVAGAERVWEGFGKVVGGVWEHLRRELRRFGEVVFPILKAFGDIAIGALDSIISAIEMVLKVFGSLVSLIGNLIKGDWQAAFNDMASIVLDTADGIKNIIGGLLGGIQRAFAEWIGSLSELNRLHGETLSLNAQVTGLSAEYVFASEARAKAIRDEVAAHRELAQANLAKLQQDYVDAEEGSRSLFSMGMGMQTPHELIDLAGKLARIEEARKALDDMKASWHNAERERFAMMDEHEQVRRVQATVEGIQHWYGEKLPPILDGVKDKVREVTGEFRSMWDAVVGHSYVPDMVDGIETEFARLDRVMVAPARAANDNVKRMFADTADAIGFGLHNAMQGLLTGNGVNSADLARGIFSDIRSNAARNTTDQLFGALGGLFGGRGGKKGLSEEGGPISLLPGGKKGGGWLDGLFSAVGSFASMIFGGGRANGGSAFPGRIYRVGEFGQEHFIPSEPGFVANDRQMRGLRGGGVNQVNHWHLPQGSDPAQFMASRGQIEGMLLRAGSRGRRYA